MDEFETFLVNVLRARKINVVQASVRIDPASEAVVGATNQRHAIFHRPKNSIGGVLPLGGAFPEPAVIGQIQKKIRLSVHILAGQMRKNVLGADQN